jgi:hypothetical protein
MPICQETSHQNKAEKTNADLKGIVECTVISNMLPSHNNRGCLLIQRGYSAEKALAKATLFG